MKVDPQMAAAVPQAVPGGAVQAARWRQALEAALWQPRGGPPAQGDPAAGGPASARSAGAAARVALLRPSVSPGHATGQAGAAAGPPPGSATGPAPGQPGSALPTSPAQPMTPAPAAVPGPIDSPAAAHTTLPRPPGPVPAPAGAQAMPSAAPPAAAGMPPQRPAEPPPGWPLSAGRACVQGRLVSASLRDARLGEAEADALRRALERRLAGSGLQLTELLVNGRLIVDRHGRT